MNPQWHAIETGLPAGPISWATQAAGQVFTSHVPIRADGTFELGQADVQVALTFDNLLTALVCAGCSQRDVVQVIVYLTDMQDAPVVHDVWTRYFQPPHPNRAIIGVADLGVPDMRIEIVATAVQPA